MSPVATTGARSSVDSALVDTTAPPFAAPATAPLFSDRRGGGGGGGGEEGGPRYGGKGGGGGGGVGGFAV